jgi:carboxyl-terminal processing protease
LLKKVLALIILTIRIGFCQAVPDNELSIDNRIFTVSKVESLLKLYLFSENNSEFDLSYALYIKDILTMGDRQKFDLAVIQFVADLHNGHTFFWDTWLDKFNQPIGFYAAPLGGYWVVQSSFLPGLAAGDIIASIDGKPTEAFFQQQQCYIAASSIAAQRNDLFLFRYLFPEQFTLTLDRNRKTVIDREKVNEPEQKTDGRWLKPSATAYIRIPSFAQLLFEEEALGFVRQFQNSKTLIIDLRNNSGGIIPKRLIRALMDRPYREWKEVTTVRIPFVDSNDDERKEREATIRPEALRNCKYTAEDHLCTAEVTWGGTIVPPSRNAYRGKVILLVNGGCISACEDMVEPFKDSGRAVIVGETTQGSAGLPYVYDFHNGMTLKIAVKRLYFPDGSEFEGVGIKPDVEVHPTIQSLKSGHDVILEKAIELASH